MPFKYIKAYLFSIAILLLSSCSDSENEDVLVNLFAAASEDIIAVSFPDTTENILSINSEYDFNLQGLKSNGIDFVSLDKNIVWSLSEGSSSQIDSTGHFTAGSVAEQLTVSASFGHLNTTFEMTISAAKFDQVIALSDNAVSIEMCQTKNIIPIARYVDDNGNEEIRPLDTTLIDSINWSISDTANTNSQKAFIKVENQQIFLTALTTADIQIQATALSLADNIQKTSDAFDVSIGNALLNLKVCRNSDTDLINCGISSINIDKTADTSLIAVGRYALSDGSNTEENITAASKWGLDNSTFISIAHSTDLKQLDISANISNTTSNISVLCGDATQNIQNINVANGVILNEAVNCNSGDINCLQTSVLVTVDALSVTSLEVGVNNLSIQSNQLLTLSTRPNEITLDVNALFSDNSQVNITADNELTYTLISSTPAVLSEQSGAEGIYTVLASGRAEIQLQYRSENFIVLISIP